jgi:hypothetical protein
MRHGPAFCIDCLLEDRLTAILCFLLSCSQLASRVITVSLLYTMHWLFRDCRTLPTPYQLKRIPASKHISESALTLDKILPCCPVASSKSALSLCSSMPHELVGLRCLERIRTSRHLAYIGSMSAVAPAHLHSAGLE